LSVDNVSEDLQSLAEVGVVHEPKPGQWVVTNFAKRQAPLGGAERVQQYRARVTVGNEPCNETLQNSYTLTETETETEHLIINSPPPGENSPPSKTAPPGAKAALDGFKARFGRMTKNELTRFLPLVELYGLEKIVAVMDWAAKKQVHLENRPALLDSIGTAAATWRANGGRKATGKDKAFLEKLEMA
jgi:hypothetical protein